MKRQQFPIIALILAVPLLGALWIGGQPPTGGSAAATLLPLLTLLLISELGLIVNLAGVILGVQHGRQQGWSTRHALVILACALAALAFLLHLIRWWPM
jgi:hypothetical protein